MTGADGEPLERRLAGHAWGADTSSELWGPRHDYRESLLLHRLPSPHAGVRALNAGCGAGSMTLKLLEAGFDVTSVDSSAGFIAAVERLLATRYPDRDAPALVGDVTALPFADASFDLIVCAEVLEHLDDDAAAARELARVLAPGGALVGSVPANPWRYDWTDAWAGHQRRYTPDGLELLLAKGGLVDVEVVAWGFPLTGFYHRHVYRRLLRRRLERPPAAPAEHAEDLARRRAAGHLHLSRVLQRGARVAFELDTLFLGRRPGYLGLLFAARAGAR